MKNIIKDRKNRNLPEFTQKEKTEFETITTKIDYERKHFNLINAPNLKTMWKDQYERRLKKMKQLEEY